MAVTHVVDTSVLKRLHIAAVRVSVESLAIDGGLARASITDLEIGYSARNAREWDKLVGALDAFHRIATSSAHLARALQVQRLLAERSQRGRKIPDLLVAAAAEEWGATVVHYDADFDRISAVTSQSAEWVVPA